MTPSLISILAPARSIALSANRPKAELILNPEPFAVSVQKPSTRTYYLGSNGRVSQRKALVGEVVATVRASTTDQARFLFSDYDAMKSYPVQVPKPFIGQPVLCSCGRYHAKGAECYVAKSWQSLAGQVQTAPEFPKVV